MVALLAPLLLSLCSAEAAADGSSKHGLNLGDLADWQRADMPLTGEHLTVFIAPHTHDDTGWLETVDGYYHDKVRWILDTVTKALARSPDSAVEAELGYQKRIFSCESLQPCPSVRSPIPAAHSPQATLTWPQICRRRRDGLLREMVGPAARVR